MTEQQARLFQYTNGELIELDRNQEFPMTLRFTTNGKVTLLWDAPLSDIEVDNLVSQAMDRIANRDGSPS